MHYCKRNLGESILQKVPPLNAAVALNTTSDTPGGATQIADILFSFNSLVCVTEFYFNKHKNQ